MNETPQLESVEQVSDGWVKKYVLTYVMPDGTRHAYESASRKNLQDYRTLLEENGKQRLDPVDSAACSNPSEPAPAAAATGPERKSIRELALSNPEVSQAECDRPCADAVCVVGRTKRDTLLLIREFRYPLNSWCIAFPAGLIGAGESLRSCADRELREETGYALAEGAAFEALPQAGYSSTGLTDETVQVVFAQIERISEAQPERNELIEPFEVPIADVPRFLAENRLPIGTRAQLVLEAFARRR